MQSWSRQMPALIVSLLALVVALSGTVYAAAKISGKTVKMKSLPGNRLTPHSVAANRLKAGLLPSPQNPLTGAQINELTLGPVPTAIFAETANRAQSALDAQTALNAVNAINATKINGYSAGCLPSTQLFAGACWESSPSGVSMSAPNAAIDCAEKGGSLPEALELAAFSTQPGVNLDSGGEWSSDIVSFSGSNVYAVATVTSGVPPVVGSAAFNGGGVSASRQFRCVTPLVK
jgi:hypothetical protein